MCWLADSSFKRKSGVGGYCASVSYYPERCWKDYLSRQAFVLLLFSSLTLLLQCGDIGDALWRGWGEQSGSRWLLGALFWTVMDHFFLIGSHRSWVIFVCNLYAIDTYMLDCDKRCNSVPCFLRAGDEKRIQYLWKNWKIDWSYGTFFRHYVTKLLPCSKYTCLLCQDRRCSD